MDSPAPTFRELIDPASKMFGREEVPIPSRLHEDCEAPVQWGEVRQRAIPLTPQRPPGQVLAIDHALAWYQPSLLARITGIAKRKRAQLEAQRAAAQAHDDVQYALAIEDHQSVLAQWASIQQLADGVLDGQESAYRDALSKVGKLNRVRGLGFKHELEAPRPNLVFVHTHLENENTAAELRHADHHRHVCSAGLRTAREVLALLPIQEVVVTIWSHIAERKARGSDQLSLASVPVLSFALHVRQCERLDFTQPSDMLIARTRYRRSFHHGGGHREIAPLTAVDLKIQ